MELEELVNGLKTDDVAQKRYLMYHIFDQLLNKKLEQLELDPGTTEAVESIKKKDGYMYKLSQDFLTQSSTMKKEQTLRKIIRYMKPAE